MTDQPKQKRADWSGTIIGLLMGPIIIYFIHIGKQDLGASIAVGLAMILIAVRIRWDLRHELWFWGVVGLVLALHVPLFFLVRWPKGWTPAVVITPFAMMDLLVILGIVHLAELIMGKAKTSIK